MQEGLITKEVKQSLENIIAQCFTANRLLDRIVSVLSIDFIMPITANIIHKGLAHRYPLLADDISEYMDARDCKTIYGVTPAGDKEYDSAIECFNEMLEINLNLEVAIKEAIKNTNDDYTTKVFLYDYLRKFIPITRDIQLLVDKANEYSESNMMDFDVHIQQFHLFED